MVEMPECVSGKDLNRCLGFGLWSVGQKAGASNFMTTGWRHEVWTTVLKTTDSPNITKGSRLFMENAAGPI
jgi:hypothetical protein